MKASTSGETRRRILSVAEQLIGERGYHAAGLEEVARRVGVCKASLFYHFASKEDLYRAVLELGVGEIAELIEATLASGEGSRLDRLIALVRAYVELVARHPARTRILLRQSLGDAPVEWATPGIERLLGRVVAFVTDGQRDGALAPVDPLAFVLGIVGIVAFYEASGPVVAPSWFGGRSAAARTAWTEQQVVDLVRRWLAVEEYGDGIPTARRRAPHGSGRSRARTGGHDGKVHADG